MKRMPITILILFLVMHDLSTQNGNNSIIKEYAFYSPKTDVEVSWREKRSWISIGVPKFVGEDMIEVGGFVFDGNVCTCNNNVFLSNETDCCAFYKVNDTILICKTPFKNYIKKGEIFYSRVIYSIDGVLKALDSGWKNGKMNGVWTLTCLTGDQYTCTYKQGVLLKKIKKSIR